MRAYPKVDYRYYIKQTQGTKLWIDFRNETTWPLQMHGREQAKEVLEATM